jgi:hypothetical protein
MTSEPLPESHHHDFHQLVEGIDVLALRQFAAPQPLHFFNG